MLSIEDARREISGHLVEHIGNGTIPQARCCLLVADAYALAVLESVEMYIIDDAVVEATRARIKALS